jgi:hypothetical protein
MLSSQPDSRRILTYGLDETLLHTRQLLLQQAGYTVDTASTPELHPVSYGGRQNCIWLADLVPHDRHTRAGGDNFQTEFIDSRLSAEGAGIASRLSIAGG